MKKIVVILMIGLALAGCVSTSDLMKSWVGKPESRLLEKWGAPDSSTRSNGRHIMTWKNTYTNRYGGNASTCRATFIADKNGVIKKWSYSNCPAFSIK